MLGTQELIIILVIVLVLFGGKKMTGLGKALGTSLREFKEEVNRPDDKAAAKQTVDVKAEEVKPQDTAAAKTDKTETK